MLLNPITFNNTQGKKSILNKLIRPDNISIISYFGS